MHNAKICAKARGFIAAAVGPGGGAPAKGLGEAPKDFTKPRQTLPSPDKQYKASTDYTTSTKTQNIRQNLKNVRQNPNILDMNPKY